MKKIFSTLLVAMMCAMSYAQTEISELIAGKAELDLEAGKVYTLNGVAELPADEIAFIDGNGATIKVGPEGKFSIQKGIYLFNVVLDASETNNCALELSANPDPSLSTEGKYPNATFVGYEAETVTLDCCVYITNNSIIRPAAKWCMRDLIIDNSIIEVKNKSGKAIINMEENGAGNINSIVIEYSTIYADDPATDMRFHRYSAQNDPWRVWGYEGDDKNATKDHWLLSCNTFVNVCGNKEFSNNMKNTNATEFTFKGNAFVNTYRINKLGSNCKRDFTQDDNVIMGGYNPVDGTDANWFTAVEDLGILWNFGEGEGQVVAPEATDMEGMAVCFVPAEAYKNFGDPRWANYVPTAIQSVAPAASSENVRKAIVNGKLVIVKNGNVYSVAGQLVK